MKLYFHKPKSRNLIIFILFLIISILLNAPFLLTKNSIINYNIDLLLLMHLLLPIVYAVLFCLIISFFLFVLKQLFCNFKAKFYINFLNILVIVEIGIAIHLLNAFTKFTTLATRTKFFEFLKQTIYFESLITDNDLSSIFYYWMYILSFSLIACSAILICSVVRLFKTKKYVLKQQEENQKKVQLNQHLGFDYENSDFYQQVKIPYSSLQQTDGTRGEFEVYHMLRKCGLTNSTYVFNREIPKSDGLTTELDLILLHNKGIFVIENKHYTTRIFGNASDHDLTIIDYKGKKKSVYNPIRQNEKHVIALQEFLQSKNLYINDKETPIYSIVVFTAEWEDKTDDIISGITTLDTKTKVCTSQNVFHVINQLILSSDSTVNINVVDIANLLSNLPLRKKYS